MVTELKSGQRYKITNVKVGTVLDLSGAKSQSLNGYPYKGYDNQHWKIERSEGGWFLRNVFNSQYLSIEQHPETTETSTTPTISPEPVEWQIRRYGNEPGYRLGFTGTAQGLDLSNQQPGTPVILATWWEGKSQVWRFDPV